MGAAEGHEEQWRAAEDGAGFLQSSTQRQTLPHSLT